ncbi:MAG TPA: type IX secretion system membrane protein PorP/SprF [Bacteroidales bacterium]|jgi:type IX secretion system PorP/SprF family membrane protein|nr:type IX secretion system membrane protein PorP/SprF [Bacteroidales bacterium]
MRRAIEILSILLFLSAVQEMDGQIAPVSDQYILNPMLINPANAGSRGSLSMAAFYRRQWAGIKGAPETINLAADSPLSDGKVGLGFLIMHDKIGVTRETTLSGLYSYKINAYGGTLAFGLRAGLMTTNTRWSELTVLDPGDELYLADSRNFVVPDFSFGTYWADSRYFAGLSIPRMIGYKFDYDRNRYSLKINPGQYYYLLNAGMVSKVTDDVNFMPSFLLSLSPGERVLFDLNAYFSFSDKMWAGASFRSNRSMAGLFQFSISNQFKIAYSYYLDFSRLGRFSNGSHEIMLRYDFMYKADIVNPLIF